jgi:hypothetical protein
VFLIENITSVIYIAPPYRLARFEKNMQSLNKSKVSNELIPKYNTPPHEAPQICENTDDDIINLSTTPSSIYMTPPRHPEV